MQRTAITSATAGSTAVAEAEGTSRATTTKGTIAAAEILEALGTLATAASPETLPKSCLSFKNVN